MYKKETKHVVAFLDLLGASEKILSEKSEYTLNVISELYYKAQTTWNKLEKAPAVLEKIKCVTFSDNIALALDLSSMNENEEEDIIGAFINYIGIFQGAALRSNLLFRGGISIGPLYMEPRDNFIWGKALVEVHNLEEHVAIYPRIVLSEKLGKYNIDKSVRICKDYDGMYFIDYINIVKKTHPDWIVQTKELIQREKVAVAQKTIGKERVLQKYEWLENYIER